MRCRYLLVALFLAVAPAARADDWPVPRGPGQEPKPYQYDAKLLKEVPKAFLEDAPACILFTRTTYMVEPDGTIVATTHEITRFNGRKGIEKLGEYRSIYYNPRYEKLTLNEARVLKADGTRVPVEPRHVQLRDVATDFQVYDEDKQLVISWPNLQVGDAYEVKWTVRTKNPEFAGEFFTRYTFGDDDFPVVRDELYVRVPEDRPLRFAAINSTIEPVRTEADGQVHYHWKVTHKQPLPRDDDRPSKEELRWQVACSTFPSWAAIGKWKQKVRAECWECTNSIKEIVAKVAGPQATPLDKARALTYWVRQNIRYLSRGPEGLGYTPHPPAQVLGNRFGDCKDQAQLLAVMLREVGVPVWLVTLGTLDDGQVLNEVPSPWGTHAILLVEIDGKEHWIDTTVSQAAWDFLPRSDCGRRVYLTKDGQAKLSRTPLFTYENYRIEQTTHVTVAPDGTTRSQRTASYHGTKRLVQARRLARHAAGRTAPAADDRAAGRQRPNAPGWAEGGREEPARLRRAGARRGGVRDSRALHRRAARGRAERQRDLDPAARLHPRPEPRAAVRDRHAVRVDPSLRGAAKPPARALQPPARRQEDRKPLGLLRAEGPPRPGRRAPRGAAHAHPGGEDAH